MVVRLQVAVRDELRRWGDAGIKLRILPGNHDQIDLGGRNALEVFDDLQHVTVYTEPTADKDGLWIPYRKRQEDIADALRVWREKREGKPGTLFMHHGIRSAWMNDQRQDTEGLPLAMFGNSDTVLCGHYHGRQQIPDRLIWYVGSPRQVTANESGQEKGYALWNGRRLQWVTTRWGPRYHRVRLAQGQALDLSDVRPGDDLRISAVDESECSRLARELDGLDVRHTVTPDVAPTEVRLAVNDGAGLGDYVGSYVDANRGELTRVDLLRVCAEIAGGVIS